MSGLRSGTCGNVAKSKFEDFGISRPCADEASMLRVSSYDRGQRSESAGGSQDGSVNRDDSDDEECVPPESGNSSDNCSTGRNEDSGDDEPVDFEGDPDEIGSDGGYESYGLADL